MQNASGETLVNRMVGAARLDVATYEEIEADESATVPALVIAAAAAIATGIGSLGGDDAVERFVVGVVVAVIGFIVFCAVAYVVGVQLLPGAATQSSVDEIMRTVGFAHTPILLSVVGIIPVIGPLIALIVWIWSIVARIVGLRQALDISTARAIAVAVISVVILGIVLVILSAVGLAIAGVD